VQDNVPKKSVSPIGISIPDKENDLSNSRIKDCKSALTKNNGKSVLQENFNNVIHLDAGDGSFREKYSEIDLGQSLSQCD
jgi:hypothetical protein